MPGESYRRVPLVEFMYLVFTRMPGESYRRVPLAEFMYLVFTRMQGESYRRRLRSLLLYWHYVFRALINSLVCCFVCCFDVQCFDEVCMNKNVEGNRPEQLDFSVSKWCSSNVSLHLLVSTKVGRICMRL